MPSRTSSSNFEEFSNGYLAAAAAAAASLKKTRKTGYIIWWLLVLVYEKIIKYFLYLPPIGLIFLWYFSFFYCYCKLWYSNTMANIQGLASLIGTISLTTGMIHLIKTYTAKETTIQKAGNIFLEQIINKFGEGHHLFILTYIRFI